MKSGASDPFADDEATREPDESTADAETDDGHAADEAIDDDGEDGDVAPAASTDAGGPESSDAVTTEDAAPDSESPPATSPGGGAEASEGATVEGVSSREQLPFVLRRDKVKDERPEVHQLFVQQPTHDRAVEAERELETRLDVDLSRTDAREAIYLAGMAHLDDAEATLREWGYDF